MARRRIGQERLKLDEHQSRRSGSLDEIAALIDWTEIDRHLAQIYASAKGEPGWPPLALFKALLLSVWYDLSDVKLAEALNDRASFRRFCGFASDEPTPERTAFVRFRRELMARSLDRVLFEAVTDQLDAMGVAVKTGTLIDASVIASASLKERKPGGRVIVAASRCTATRLTSRPTSKAALSAPLRSRPRTCTTAPCWRRCCQSSPEMFTPTAPMRHAGSRM